MWLVEGIKNHCDRLEARIKELEGRPANLQYRGVWDYARDYQKGDGVTFDGSIWVALRPTRQRPGDTGARQRDWQVAVKRGAR